MATTRVLETAGADIVYDIHGRLPTADGWPPLLMIGQPMTASGFDALASYFPDRTVVTYDPRGLGRSARRDGRVDHSPSVQAVDVHAVIEALGARPVEMFASSGGAVTALALVAAYPADVVTLVAHEPPLIPVRVVIAVGEESDGTFTGRSAVATAELLGRHATVFPSHHGGFVGGGSGYAGQPEAFARRLRDVLDEH
jgi:pimeloyl-ACP methyl ester carboxylesterase